MLMNKVVAFATTSKNSAMRAELMDRPYRLICLERDDIITNKYVYFVSASYFDRKPMK